MSTPNNSIRGKVPMTGSKFGRGIILPRDRLLFLLSHEKGRTRHITGDSFTQTVKESRYSQSTFVSARPYSDVV